jgi:ABC-type multidrug transport system permease subunit
MIGIVRLVVFGIVVMSLMYVLISIYSRSVRREKLEKEWDTDPAREGAPMAEREAFIEAGMIAYQTGLRRRLIWLVFVIPTAVVAVIVYLVNYQ